jgi:hypothetical protein
MATGTQNPYKAAAQMRKVIALTSAADRILDSVAGDDRLYRQMALSDLIRALEGDLDLGFDAWTPLVCSAEVISPSDETKAMTITALREGLVLCSGADPFRGLQVVS